MRNEHPLSGKERTGIKTFSILYQLRNFIDKVTKLIGRKKRPILASLLSFVLIVSTLPVGTLTVHAEGAESLIENFDDISTLSEKGWTMKNNTNPLGSTNWYQGNSNQFTSYNGYSNSYIGADFYNASGYGTISNWLITPKLSLKNGSTLTFYSKSESQSSFPDRLEVRMSTSGSNPGSAATDVGDFTTLLLTINPDLVTNVYPTEWTKYTATITNLPEETEGYLAFRYFVTNGGTSGNGWFIGIDAVSYPIPAPIVTASDYDAPYDGQSHGVNLNVKTPGATVKYRTTDSGAYDLTDAPTFSDVGTHTVWYQISKEGYHTIEGSNTVNITPKNLTVNLAVSDKNYDGLNTATFSTAPSLNGVVNGDNVSLVNGIPRFSSIDVDNTIPIDFTAFTITGEDAGNYSLIQPSGITASILQSFTPEKDTHYSTTVLNTGWTNTDYVISAKSGFLVSLTNTADGTWVDSLTADSEETDNGSITFYIKNVATGEISIAKTEEYKMDKTAPTGDIKIGESSIKKALNAITFGHFFKETQTITITAADAGSEVESVAYKLSSSVLDEAAVLEISDWTAYTNSFTVEPNSQKIVYVKIVDKVGNISYLGSDGLVLDSIAPVISGIEDGKTYCDVVTVNVTDANLDTVTVDGATTTLIEGNLNLSPTGKAQTVVATDKAGNSTELTVTVYDGHTWDEGVITLAPTASKKGVKTFTCIVCGETKTEDLDKLTPEIIEGKNTEWKQGDGSPLAFRSNADFSDFISVLVDGTVVDAKHYDLKEGSIMVTLKEDYLASLPAGKHVLSINSTSGTASAEFTITAKTEVKEPAKTVPKTGDNSNLLLWITLLLVSGGTLTVFGFNSRKRNAIK